MDKEIVVDSQHFDANIGSVYIEIPLMLSSESGEAKHTDLNNQELFLAYEISRFLKTLSTEGAALSELTFWGTMTPGIGEPIRKIEFSKDL
jgi:hypothetical protein